MYNLAKAQNAEPISSFIVFESKDKRQYYLDILRVLSIIGVTLIHSSSVIVVDMTNIGSLSWWIANIINSSSRWAVPVFFMISGALLLDAPGEIILKDFYKKRFSKIILPFLIWSIIYSIIKHYFLHPDFPNWLEMPGIIFREFLFDQVYVHFWFLYVLTTVYIILPFIKKLISNLDKKELRFWLIGWFVVSFVYKAGQQLYTYITNESLYISLLNIPFFSGYLGFFLLGYYLHKYSLATASKNALYILGFLAFLLIPLMTYINSAGKDFLDETFYGHFSLATVFTAISVFLFIKNTDWNTLLNTKMKKLIVSLSNSTFGIYFIHLLIQLFVFRFFLDWLFYNSMFVLVFYAVNLIANFMTCYMCVKFASLNNYINKALFG